MTQLFQLLRSRPSSGQRCYLTSIVRKIYKHVTFDSFLTLFPYSVEKYNNFREMSLDGRRRVEIIEPTARCMRRTRLCKVGCIDDPDATVVRIVHLSDTHGQHDEVDVPDGDVLIHSGDFFDWKDTNGFEKQIEILNEFFAKKPHRHKIFVAGNHELKFCDKKADVIRSCLKNVSYLEDSSLTVDGLRFYGSPWTGDRQSPAFAYTAPYGELGSRFWSSIPTDTDILVTHSPPKGILDHHGGLGSDDLRDRIMSNVRPLAHLFGHAHYLEASVVVMDNVLFSNGTTSCSPDDGTVNVIDVHVARK